MSALAASSSAIPSVQMQLYQMKLQQARQAATQADNEVSALESQTNAARRDASAARSEVSSLEQQTREAQRASQSTMNTQGQITGRLVNLKA